MELVDYLIKIVHFLLNFVKNQKFFAKNFFLCEKSSTFVTRNCKKYKTVNKNCGYETE